MTQVLLPHPLNEGEKGRKRKSLFRSSPADREGDRREKKITNPSFLACGVLMV
jgi:hypothetical protein